MVIKLRGAGLYWINSTERPKPLAAVLVIQNEKVLISAVDEI